MNDDKHIAISEVYGPVLQGEGPMAGRATIFVRVFGCDSLCKCCDSLYAVDPARSDAKRLMLTTQEIVSRVHRLASPHSLNPSLPVTFSGGNPAIWDLGPVVEELREHHEIWVETQGTKWRDWLSKADLVVISPKGPFMNDQKYGVLSPFKLQIFDTNLRQNALVFKVVVGGEDDLDYAEEIAEAFPRRSMYLSVGAPREEGVLRIGVGIPEINTESLFLLHRYRHLSELLLSQPKRWPDLIERAHFLPQLHILTHGDARGV